MEKSHLEKGPHFAIKVINACFFVEQGKRWQSREVHHHLGEEPGLHVGVEVSDGGQRMGFCPRERWRRTGRVRRTSGKSEIRLLSSKITLFGVKMTTHMIMLSFYPLDK